MKPALRKQLFERWKELGCPSTFGSFNHFVYRISEHSKGLVYVQINGVWNEFFSPKDALPFCLDVLEYMDPKKMQ